MDAVDPTAKVVTQFLAPAHPGFRTDLEHPTMTSAAPRVRIPIYGLICGGGGADGVERALAYSPGVVDVYVNPATEAAYIAYEPALTNVARLIVLIERSGYRAGRPVED